MFNKKISIYFLSVSIIASSTVTYYISKHGFNKMLLPASASSISKTSSVSETSCDLKALRLKGFKYTQPLLLSEIAHESGSLNYLKKQMEDYLLQSKQAGIISSASVYLKSYKDGEWLNINEHEVYNPGSLLKIPILITFLKMNEEHPGLLNKKLIFQHPEYLSKQTLNSNQIQSGKEYSVKELLNFMITFSDNNATYLLNSNIDLKRLKKVFTDLGMPEPVTFDKNFSLTSKDYSTFFKVLYNAGYLNTADSEYAMGLLSRCDFIEGMSKGIPENTPIAHKFGEAGEGNVHQLHESGIIYCDNTAFLLTVMTKGGEVFKLPEVLKNITKICYNGIKSNDFAVNN